MYVTRRRLQIRYDTVTVDDARPLCLLQARLTVAGGDTTFSTCPVSVR